MIRNVLHLPFSLASQAGILSDALNDDVINSFSAFKSSYLSEYTPDFELGGAIPVSIFRRFNCFIRTVGRFDFYCHHTGDSLLSHYLGCFDAKINTKIGKKCIPIFYGSELRRPSLELKRNPFYENAYKEDDLKVVKMLEFWADLSNSVVICDPAFLDYGLNNYFENVYYIPIAIDLSKYEGLIKDGGSPIAKKRKIVHLPSLPEAKGTQHIRAAIKALEADGILFEYRELTGIPHAEVKNELLDADLVIDQMMLGAYGVLALEAMALKKPVVGYILPSTLKYYPDELPIINCDPKTLKSTLADWIAAASDQYKTQGDKSYQYVKKYHASNVVSEKFRDIFISTS